MATIRKVIDVAVSADAAWDAVRDYANLHVRLVPGFATDVEIDGNDRLVTFFTGSVLRERLVTLDDAARRLVWSIVDGPYSHHNGSVEVSEQVHGCRLVWTADVLPDEAAERTDAMMQRGAEVMKATLGAGERAA